MNFDSNTVFKFVMELSQSSQVMEGTDNGLGPQQMSCGALQDEAEDDDEAPASQVRQRYERMFRERQKAGGDAPEDAEERPESASQPVFQGAISTVFAKYLRCDIHTLFSCHPPASSSLQAFAFVKAAAQKPSICQHLQDDPIIFILQLRQIFSALLALMTSW